MYQHPNDIIHYLQTLQVDAYHPEYKIADQKIVKKLREAGFFVNVFTVNQPKRQTLLFEWGVNGIFTDFLK
jgi:glycerophosphoryl diester phosphodiesterase